MDTSLQTAIDFPPPLPAELEARIEKAQRAALSDCEAAVLDLLVRGSCAGREKAMQISAMQRHWARNGAYVWKDRLVKDAVKCLVEWRGVPIGSSRNAKRPGYYLILDDSEAQDTAAVLYAQGVNMIRRAHILNPRRQYIRELNGQERIELCGGTAA